MPSTKPQCPFSVKELEGTDPYSRYEEMRKYGDILWDEAMKSWLVPTADGCRRLMSNDVTRLRFWTANQPDTAEI